MQSQITRDTDGIMLVWGWSVLRLKWNTRINCWNFNSTTLAIKTTGNQKLYSFIYATTSCAIWYRDPVNGMVLYHKNNTYLGTLQSFGTEAHAYSASFQVEVPRATPAAWTWLMGASRSLRATGFLLLPVPELVLEILQLEVLAIAPAPCTRVADTACATCADHISLWSIETK